MSPARLCITTTFIPTVQGAPNKKPELEVVSISRPLSSPVFIKTRTTCSPTRLPSGWTLSCKISVTTPFSKVCPSRETSATLST